MPSLKADSVASRLTRCALLSAICLAGAGSAFGQISTSTTASLAPSPVDQGTTPVATVTVTASDGSTPDSSATCAIQTRGHSASYSATLQGGVASISLPSVAQDPVGNYTLACSYAGSSNYAASSANTISFSIISPISTTTTVSVASSSVIYGSGSSPVATVTVTASDGSTPTGSVTCNIQTRGHAAGYTSALTNGSASLPLTSIAQDPVGTYSLVCSYAGYSSYTASSSSTISLNVNQAVPIITWAAPASISAGTALSATQLDATTNIAGTFAYSPAAGTVLPAGSNTLSVTFTPNDTTDYAAVTDTVTLAVNGGPTTISLATSATPVNYGSPVTFTATISDGPTGNVAFHDGGIFIGNGAISGNTATLTTNNLSVGTHTMTASWQGDANYSSATSNPITQLVNGVTLSGQPGVITTVAGTGIPGYSGDGGLATLAQISGPIEATDAGNNLYTCEGGRIRQISATTGIITTVAGNGTAGFTGDGGQATNAEISCSDLAVDTAGDLFIVNGTTTWNGGTGSPVIRKVAAGTGIITTIAGEAGSSPGQASCNGGGQAVNAVISPQNLGVDGAGNIYFVNNDYEQNYELCTVTAATGGISSLGDATSPSGSADGLPDVLAVDASGNAYLFTVPNPVSGGSGLIYKVSSAPGYATSIVAGVPGTSGHTGDGGPAVNAEIQTSFGTADAAGNLYIRDWSDNDIRKIDAATGIISVVATRGGYGCLQQIDNRGDGCLSTDAPAYLWNYPNYEDYAHSDGILAVDSIGNIYDSSDSPSGYIRGISAPPSTQIQPSVINVLPCQFEVTYGTTDPCNVSVTSGATGTVSFAYASYGESAGVVQLGTPTYVAPTLLVSGAANVTLPTSTLPVGSYIVFITYNGDGTYVPSIQEQQFTVQQAAPVISWPAPGQISYGTPLSAQQLNASTSVPGVLTYTPGLNTVLPVGSNTLQVTFSPTDSTDYSAVTLSQTISVVAATPSVTWLTPAPIQYGTPLSSSQLDATANVPGTFAYSYAEGSVLPVGSQTLSVTFTPTSSSYAPITASVQISVIPDTPVIASILPNPVGIGTAVMISGQNFGPSQGSSTVTFNGVPAAVTSWTDNSVGTTVPVGASTGNVVVTVGGIPSNSFLIMIPTSCTVTP